nr:MAG TPA: DnaA protein [Caudoviricetes sp.]
MTSSKAGSVQAASPDRPAFHEHNEGTTVDQPTTALDTPEAVLANLAQLRQRQEEDRKARIASIRHARAIGLSNQAIGAALGITEAAVRMMIKRVGDPTSQEERRGA